MAREEIVEPHFKCIWKACKSNMTRMSPCYERSHTGVETRVVTCEECWHSYEIRWAADRPLVRVPTKIIPPWCNEGQRLLIGYGLYDPADPRAYADGIVPKKHKR